MDAKQRIERNEELCRKLLSRMKRAGDEAALYEQLKEYIRLKFLIEDDPFWDDDIAAVAAYSIRKTIEQSGDPAKLSDLGINCAGAASATTKHLLLVLSLQKGLGVRLDPDDVAAAGTVHSLAALLLSALRAGENV